MVALFCLEVKMKVKVLKAFKDLEMDKIHSVGDTFEVEKKRGSLLIEKNLVQEIPEEKKVSIETTSLGKKEVEKWAEKSSTKQKSGKLSEK